MILSVILILAFFIWQFTLFKNLTTPGRGQGAKKKNAWFPCSSVGTRKRNYALTWLNVRYWVFVFSFDVGRSMFDVRRSSFFCVFAPLREIFLF